MPRLLPSLALVGLLPLAACADLGEMRTASPFTTATTPATLTTEVGADRALARLPAEAGAVVSVTERREKDRLTQTVTLAAEAAARGGNRIRVVVTSNEPGVLQRMTDERLETELAAEFPGLDMKPTGRMTTAGGAPLGVAVGRAAEGATCAYGWQETRATPQGGRSGGFFAAEEVDLSVRVRLCRQGLSEDRMAALVEALTLRGDVSVRGAAGPSVASGVDALASAGYGRAAPISASEPLRPPAREPVRAEKPAIPSAANRAAAKPRLAPTEARATVAPTADPIPLPSGS